MKIYRYEGKLELFYEQGMECLMPALHDNRGIRKSPSFNNETKKCDGPEQEFHSIEWLLDFKGGEYIEVFDTNDIVLYSGSLTKDKKEIIKHSYNYSFIPKEIDFLTWHSWCSQNFKAVIFTNKLIDAQK
jgi:hypothetical protein